MSNRSRASWGLAHALKQAIECPVEVNYHGQRKDSYGGWHVAWCDGPTRDTMKAVIEKHRPRFPEFTGVELWCDRGHRDVSEVSALLAFLEANPGRLTHFNSFMVDEAWDGAEYPERLPEATKERARALLKMDPTCRDYFSLATQEELRKRCLGGWDAVATWLDEFVAARKDPAVTDLGAVRRQRQAGRAAGGTR